MWNDPETVPDDTRVLVSANGKVWIGRRSRLWDAFRDAPFDKPEWSIEGKTRGQIRAWDIEGWLALPTAASPRRRSPPQKTRDPQ